MIEARCILPDTSITPTINKQRQLHLTSNTFTTQRVRLKLHPFDNSVADLLYELLYNRSKAYNKSTTNRNSGVWALTCDIIGCLDCACVFISNCYICWLVRYTFDQQHCAQCKVPLFRLLIGWFWAFLPRRGNTFNWWGCGSVTGRYGTIRSVTELLRKVTGPWWKISILPISNWILNFAYH